MKHFGPEPPWTGESELGRWVYVKPDPRLWLPEPGYWEWRPERSTIERLNDAMAMFYLPVIQAHLNEHVALITNIGSAE